MSEIKEKLEGELKAVKSLCETMENAIKTELEKGLDHVNTHEMYEAVDIYKDLSEVKKNIVETCYKIKILEAMEDAEEEHEEEEKYLLQRMKEEYGEEDGQRYYNEYRYANGRYAPKGRGTRRGYGVRYHVPEDYAYPEYMRDIDRRDGRMYYMDGMKSESDRSNVRTYSDGYNDGESHGYERGYSEGKRMSGGGRYDRARRSYEETKANKTGNQQEDVQREMRELEKTLNAFEGELSELLPKMSQSEKNLVKNKVSSWQNKVQ